MRNVPTTTRMARAAYQFHAGRRGIECPTSKYHGPTNATSPAVAERKAAKKAGVLIRGLGFDTKRTDHGYEFEVVSTKLQDLEERYPRLPTSTLPPKPLTKVVPFAARKRKKSGTKRNCSG